MSIIEPKLRLRAESENRRIEKTQLKLSEYEVAPLGISSLGWCISLGGGGSGEVGPGGRDHPDKGGVDHWKVLFRKLCICILYVSCYVKNVFSTMAIVRRSSPVAQLACVGGSARLVSCPTRLYFN